MTNIKKLSKKTAAYIEENAISGKVRDVFDMPKSVEKELTNVFGASVSGGYMSEERYWDVSDVG